MTFDMLEELRKSIRKGRDELIAHVKPRDATERAICNALGECSWDECVRGIEQYRAESRTE